ncbi:DUF4097 family beta strand repeat-containing protein [Jeotgalibacillus terrae]|uniref:DUF4097 domain-containing protein n=1 Tax=Jeotgalibacillus terrae TaxID=587735 RepID=A0ABW5ZEY5_9BACL|nr:DUF4097 family beta strand repeat-containing protein [Jeotgalibacillus terrae]MBM7580091.1 DUF4097 and DUF4098 domain-containing protein YvlB [Jeotgalibacillus terrae]
MENERQRILSMVEKGTITASEALTLLEALEKDGSAKASADSRTSSESTTSSSTSTHQEKTYEQQSRSSDQSREYTDSGSSQKKEFPFNLDEMINDLFGTIEKKSKEFKTEQNKKNTRQQQKDKLTDFVQTAFEKVKGLDLEFNMGPSLEFKHVFESEKAELIDLEASISNGKLTIRPWDEDFVRAECNVKVFRSDDEFKAKQQLKDSVIFNTNFKKLRFVSDLKMMSLDTVLYVPKANFERWDIRLFNGKFQAEGGNVNKVKVRTANGKIELSNMLIEKAELETANGGINVENTRADLIEAESVNGKVNVEGALDEIDAQSVNGKIVCSTSSSSARRIEAKSLAGPIEINVPETVSLDGTLRTNFGKLRVDFDQMDHVEEREEMMQRRLNFRKDREGASKLYITADAKTGAVTVKSYSKNRETNA